jgi:UDP-N-acetylmuramate dehydrogenase
MSTAVPPSPSAQLPEALHRLRPALLASEPLAKYTAARLGGPADYLLVARDRDVLALALLAAWRADYPVRILGGGSNVLVSDAGVRGLVIIDDVREVAFAEVRPGVSLAPGSVAVTVSGGYALTVLARKCAARGLAGFEWAASVPGTVGGAVVNNAGAHDGDMASNVVYVEIVDRVRGPVRLTAAELAYDYRSSSLKTRPDRDFLVLTAGLHLQPDDPQAISARIDANIDHRKRTQPPGASLGSIFKNPPGDYAGRLIEHCGLKGHRIGGAMVSPKHANFFINDPAQPTTAADYRALIEHVRETVLSQTGVELHPEIEFVGKW